MKSVRLVQVSGKYVSRMKSSGRLVTFSRPEQVLQVAFETSDLVFG